MQLPKKLDDAFASGSPKGLEGTVTAGQISAVRNFREIRNVAPNTLLLGYDADTQFIQMTNPISAGNSGGPLVNIFGEVVGVNTCSVVRAQNLNFAVASNHVQALLEKAKGESVRSLLTLPRRVRPEPPRRTRAPELVRPVPFEAKLPDGRTVTRHSVSVPEEIVKSLLKDDSRVDADVENVGKIEAGVLLGVGPSLFGLPDGYALIRHNDFDAPKPPATFRTLYETTVRTLEQESRERRRAVSSRYGIPMPYRSREPEVDMQGIVGIVGFKRGQLDGHVHLFDQHPIYYGQWTGGRPSPQALFFIETAPGIGAIKRA